MTLSKLLALGVALVGSACAKPGVKARGIGEGSVDGRPWAGPCLTRVDSRWSNWRHPHRVRFEDSGSEYVVEVFTGRRFRPGQMTVSSRGDTPATGWVLQGNTVRGTVEGVATVSVLSDTTVIRVSGRRVHRDSGPLDLECRLDP